MKLKKLLLLTLAFSMCTAAALPALAQGSEPSLGEVARKNKSKDKAKRVITDEDMPTRSGRSAPPASAQDNSPASQTRSTSDDSKPPEVSNSSSPSTEKKDESKPSTTAEDGKSAKQERIAFLKSDRENINKIIEQMQQRLTTETVDSRRRMWSEMLEHAQDRLKENEKALSDAESSSSQK